MRARLIAGLLALFALALHAGVLAQAETQTSRYHIRGMVCQACADHVQEAIAEVEGVRSSRVELDERMAYVVWETTPRHDALAQAVRDAGFQAYRAGPIQPTGPQR